jgi:RHS repeat-associated protein
VTQGDLNQLRQNVQSLMTTYYLVAPEHFNLESSATSQAFPIGLRWSEGVAIKPSLMDAIGDGKGKFTKVPGEYAQSGQTLYSASFIDAPLLWIHFTELQKAIASLRYSYIGEGLYATWTAAGEQNTGYGYGAALVPGEAKVGCETNYALTRRMENLGPGAVTTITAPSNEGYGWQASAIQRYSRLTVSGLDTRVSHSLQFYILGRKAAPDPHRTAVFDANGTVVREEKWTLWFTAGTETGAVVQSSAFGRNSPFPAWCDTPVLTPGWNEVCWRGYGGAGMVAVEWTFHDGELVPPRFNDPEEDGIADLGCGCSSCPLEACAVWEGLQPQAKVVIPLGVSDGALSSGLRVKAYLTEYEINGCARQMYSLFTGVKWVASGDADWMFVCIQRPSGYEMVFPVTGRLAGQAINLVRRYRLKQSGNIVTLRFPEGNREVKHEFQDGSLSRVLVKRGRNEIKTETDHNNGVWPGLSTEVEFIGTVGRFSGVNTSLLLAKVGYVDTLVRTVEHRYKVAGLTNRVVYYQGSKGFRTLDSQGRAIWDTRVVTDPTNGLVEIWSGISTNNGLRVARKERRRSWTVPETNLVMVAHTRWCDDGILPVQSNVTGVTIAPFPWGEEKVSETVAAGTACEATSRHVYYTEAADSNNYGRLKRVEEAEGNWTEYAYDAAGRNKRVHTGFKSAAAGNLLAARETEYWYAGDPLLSSLNMPAADSLPATDDCPRLVVEKVEGREVARTYHSYQQGRDVTVRCPRREASYNDSSNLVSVTSYHTNGSFLGRVTRVDRPDGTFSTFTYSHDATRKQLTTTEDSGAGAGGVVTNGVRTSRLTDVAERTLKTTTIDIASGTVLSLVTNVLDGLGRVVCTSNTVDGTFSRTEQGCCGPDEERDAEGISTHYVYDELKQVYAMERLGVTHYSRYDVAGNLTETRGCVAGKPDIVTTSTYDDAGRLIRTVDARGAVTLRQYRTNALGERVVTTILPDGSTQVETSYLDGQLKSVTGTAVRAQFYDYGADEQGVYSVVYEGEDNSAAQWTRTYADRLGRAWLTLHSDGHRVETRYDRAGRMVSITDGLTTHLTAYNAKGEAFRSAVDMDGNAEVDLAGDDRVSETISRIESFQGKSARKNEHRVYAASGTVASSLAEEHWRSLDGATAWSVAFGRTNRVDTVRSPAHAARKETVTAPEGTRSVSWFTNGLLKRAERQAVGGQVMNAESYGHDAYGRVTNQVAIGPNGEEIWTAFHYDDGGNVTGQTVTAGGLLQAIRHDYDVMGRRIRTVLPDGGEVTFEYEPTGELCAQAGVRTYPVRYGYDERGRLTAVETFRGDTNAVRDVTRWGYEARRGWLTAKIYADGSTNCYEYRPDGKLVKRVWARGVETVYSFDAAGSLTNVSYSDGTPGVAMRLDRLGRALVVRDGTGVRTNVYAVDGSVLREILPAPAGEIGYESDALGRRTNLQVRGVSGDTICRAGYRYDEAGRLLSVRAGDMTARYSYGGDAETVTGLVVAVGGEDRLVGTRQHDALGRLQRVGWESGSNSVATFQYGHTAASLRSRCTMLDGSYWVYEYDELGQMVAGRKFTAAGQPVSGRQFEYNYDLIGNRNWATEGGGGRHSYSVNELNQYTRMSIPDLIRQIAWSGSVFTFGGGPGGGVSPGPTLREVHPCYDRDGNLTGDGRFTYVWDGENRLVLASNLQTRIAFSYDYLSRRVRKSVFAKTPESWLLTSDSFFAYDGWNLIRAITDTPTPPYSVTNSYTWGLDLSGTLQGAGGIGGLLSASHGETTSVFYCHDGNGNVTDLVDTNGTPVARYEYDPFGHQIAMTGVDSTNNPFRFSTKYVDEETGLIYYGHRYYSPTMGRWLTRDPLGEAGGINLYGFVGNGAVNFVDRLGLALYAFDGTGARYETWTHVSILHRSYSGIAHYREGVGSRWYSSVLGGATGAGGTVRLDDMYRLLVETYKKGDKDIDIIGFSRGASLAREFANMIYEKGIEDTTYRWERNGTSGLYDRVVDSRLTLACAPKIRFVGLFDTVGSFGIAGNDINIGIRMGLPPNVEHAAQAIARDERRSQFPLTPLNAPTARQRFSQQVFSGDHSDIGGGHEEEQNLLALDPLRYIWSAGRAVGVPFGPLDIVSAQDGRFLKVAGELRPWAYRAHTTPHDLTTSILYTDGGVRKNLPGGMP